MGKNHAQNTRTMAGKAAADRKPCLINNLWISNETSRTIVQRTVFNTLSLNLARVLSKRIHVRNEDHRTADSFHAITGNQPGTRCGKSPLHQVRESPGREPGPSSLSAPVNSNYPAPILPGQVRGRQARCPRTTRLYRLHRTRGRPLQSSSRIRPRRPAATYQTRRNAFAILPGIYRSPVTPGARPRGRPGRRRPAGGDGGHRRVRGGSPAARAVT